MPTVEIVRVVVASPGDVQAERDCLDDIAAELNRGIARDRDVRVELTRWETDAYPGFHTGGPQAGIGAQLRIESCDLLLGIFWKRFGTPVADAQSGTEHEFKLAYEAWKRNGHPQIMVYFKQEPHTPTWKAETDQWGQVLEFQRSFPREGLWWTFKSTSDFKDTVREHLSHFIRDHYPKVQAAQPPVPDVVDATPMPVISAPAPASGNQLSAFAATKRAGLQQRLTNLQEEWTAVNAEIDRNLNPADRLRLERKAQSLEEEILKLEADLSRL